MADEIQKALLKKFQCAQSLYEEGKYEEIWNTIYLPESTCFLSREEPCNKAEYPVLLKKFKEDIGIARWEISNTNFVILSDTAAVTTSSYKALSQAGAVLRKGNIMTVYQKKEGDWFVRFNMHNE